MEQLELFLINYNNNAIYNGKTYKELLNNICIHIVPMVNPDGVSISQLGEKGIKTKEDVEKDRKQFIKIMKDNGISIVIHEVSVGD